MQKQYQRVNWENEPSTKTPKNAENFNTMDSGIDELEDRVIEEIERIDGAISSLATKEEVEAKQDALTFDDAPTENSTNPVTSGGVYTALQGVGSGSGGGSSISVQRVSDVPESYMANEPLIVNYNWSSEASGDGFVMIIADNAVKDTKNIQQGNVAIDFSKYISEIGERPVVVCFSDSSGNTKWFHYKIVLKTNQTWANASPQVVKDLLAQHYAGEINLYEYWNVGDVRIIHLSEIPADQYAPESHEEQDIRMMLVHKGNVYLEDRSTECAFVVAMPDTLITEGRMHNIAKYHQEGAGWWTCDRRKWANSSFANAFPEDIRDVFKNHLVYGVTGYPLEGQDTIDRFELAAPASYNWGGHSIPSGIKDVPWEAYTKGLVGNIKAKGFGGQAQQNFNYWYYRSSYRRGEYFYHGGNYSFGSPNEPGRFAADRPAGLSFCSVI